MYTNEYKCLCVPFPLRYGNCVATYGLKDVVFRNMTCRAPTLQHPLPNHRIDTTMFIFFTSFGGLYPDGNSVVLDGACWKRDVSGPLCNACCKRVL